MLQVHKVRYIFFEDIRLQFYYVGYQIYGKNVRHFIDFANQDSDSLCIDALINSDSNVKQGRQAKWKLYTKMALSY